MSWELELPLNRTGMIVLDVFLKLLTLQMYRIWNFLIILVKYSSYSLRYVNFVLNYCY